MEKIIKSKSNPSYKELVKLKSKKYRNKLGCYIEEGRKLLEDLELVQEVYIEEGVSLDNREMSSLKLKNIEVKIIEKKLFKEVSTQENSQGIIIKRKKYPVKKISDNIVVVIDKVQDPGNIGTIIRIIDAVGFNDVILIKGTVDPYNEKSIRSTMGSIRRLNIIEMEEIDTINYLKKNDYKFIGTVLSDESVLYENMELETKTAIIFGSEGQGISANLIDELDQKIIIPIYGGAESLNVAIATALTLYKVREKIGG